MLARAWQDIKAAVFIEDTMAKWFKSHLTAKGKEMKGIRALMLVLALSACAYGGEMENDRTGNIPNDKAGWMESDKTGEMECDRTGDMETGKTNAIDPVTATAWQLLQSLLPLF
jgi:hypothetical protein